MNCNWLISFKKSYLNCDRRAIWRNGNWILCDFHKNLLLNSYNEKYKIRDTPNWDLISETIDYQI